MSELACEVRGNCLMYVMWKEEQCTFCCFAKDRVGSRNNFQSIDGQPHPRAFKGRKAVANKEKDKDKQALSKRASKAEEGAYKRVEKTLNSGRSHQDGDYTIDDILIDNKLQSKSKNITVKPDELKKAKKQAANSMKKFAALRIENEDGSAFYVMSEEDFLRLIK